MPDSQHDVPHSIASDQGTHFTAREVQKWAHGHGIHWSYHVPHHLEAAGLIERCNGLLKTVTGPIMRQQHGGLGQESPEGCMCFESASNTWYGFYHSQDLQTKEARGGKGESSNHCHP